MEFSNLTSHAIKILNGQGNLVIEVPPSGAVARVAATSEVVGVVNGVSLFTTQFGEVDGLPEAQEGVIFITSLLVRSAVPDRRDVASPGELVRDSAGQPMGCKGLSVNR